MGYVQIGLDELGRDLADITWCVVDLETTGGSAAAGSRITEIGAVKVRGGQVCGEFATLVNPDVPVPGFITVLTGITNAMVCDAPHIEAVLPSFLEFARGCVLVAHNAPFDVGFLRHAAAELDIEWPRFEVLDTVKLARRVLSRDEAHNCKLSTLAAKFSSVEPDHRALTDARATVDVMHALFERLGNLGVSTLEELRGYTSAVSDAQRRKRHLADHLPEAPGVYLFRDRADEVLYVGTSKSLRSRVRTYFTASETRSRMGEMVGIAERVEGIVCATALEAQVRELRLIDRHRPPYNRRSKHPETACWVKLSIEPWPRLTIVKSPNDSDASYLGPFSGRTRAEAARDLLNEVFAVRECTQRLGRTPTLSTCVLADFKRCLAPCDGRDVADIYEMEVDRLRGAITDDPSEVVEFAHARMAALANDERFEEAAEVRDRLTALTYGLERGQRIGALAANPELVAAAPLPTGEWQVHIVKHGRLAAAGVKPADAPAAEWTDALLATSETVAPVGAAVPSALIEETETVARWLAEPSVRIVRSATVQE